MKYFLSAVGLVCVLVAIFAFGGNRPNEENLRLCIMSNSNSDLDIKIEYDIKRAVTELFEDRVCIAEESVDEVEKLKKEIEDISRQVVMDNGCFYKTSCVIVKENLDNFDGKSGKYMTIKIFLGNGVEESWWYLKS